MYCAFDTLAAAYAHLRVTRQNRQLWTILHFGAGRYYVFTSTASPGGQMFNIARNITTQSGHYGRGLPHGREIAHFLGELLTERATSSGLAHPGRHAEEWMIGHFADVLNHATTRNGGSPLTQALILNSDTPCSLLDADPSSNLTGWPVSCTRKLVRLAQQYTQLDFSVFYMRKYGGQGAHTTQQIGSYFRNALRQNPGGRIALYPYTSQMRIEVSAYSPL